MMRMPLGFKNGAVALLVFVSLLLGVPGVGHAGEESPPAAGAEHLYGPAIEGDITLTDADGDPSTPGLLATLTGNCRGQGVNLLSTDPLAFPFRIADVTVQTLENRRLGLPTTIDVPQCGYPFPGQLIITTVSRLTTMTTAAFAHVVILAVRPLP